MKSKHMLFAVVIVASVFSAADLVSQAQTSAPVDHGPGVQSPQDPGYPALIATCKTPPPGRGGARGGAARGPARGPAVAKPEARPYTITEIPGVIAAGQQWKEIWEEVGNNADGIIATKDGGVIVAQNDKSDVVKIDKDGKASVPYVDTNTGGALSMNKKGELFLNSRGLHQAILELAPKRRVFTDKYNGDPIDCIGGALNDLAADSKGGVYFTMGGLFYANPKGEITKYGENLTTNGIVLSADEKILYVTNGPALAAFDVQPDGSLSNQREFTRWDMGGGDGSTIDSMGRLYVTVGASVHVIGTDGKQLGVIPTPYGLISVAFSGPDKRTLYVVTNTREGDLRVNPVRVLTVQMIAQGYKGRAK
jgi:gluconolactonase